MEQFCCVCSWDRAGREYMLKNPGVPWSCILCTPVKMLIGKNSNACWVVLLIFALTHLHFFMC